MWRLRELRDQIKWGFQRMFRGYDDRMLWHFPSFFLENAILMLKHLRDNAHGYPVLFENEEEWYVVLNAMLDGFEYGLVASEDDYPFYEDYENKKREYGIDDSNVADWFKPNELKDKARKDVGGYERLRDEIAEYGEKNKEALLLFVKYFWNLWD